MYQNILVPIDLGDPDSWQDALPAALNYAKLYQAKLHFLTVIPDFGMTMVGQFFPNNFEKQAVSQAETALKAFVTEHVGDDIPHQTHIGHGTVYKEILEASESLKADLIVIGSHRPELKDYLLGPNAARVVRHANCSVLVARPKP